MTPRLTTLGAIRFEHTRRQLAVLASILVTPTVVFAAVDISLAGHEPGRLLALAALRVLVIAVFLALAVHLLRPPTLITPYFIEVILIIGLDGMLPAHWRRQLGPCLLITGVGLVLLVAWHTEFDAIHRAAVAVALVLASAIGIAFGWHQDWLAQRERQLAEQARVAREALDRTAAELRSLQICPGCLAQHYPDVESVLPR